MVFRLWVLLWAAELLAPAQWFAGGGAGISTLSADGQTTIDSATTAISLYKPENGLSAHLFAGRHLNDFFSLQGSYTWNRNALGLTGTRLAAGVESTFQQDFRSRSQTGAAECLLYFRPRANRFRPFVAGGLGVLLFHAEAGATTVSKGTVKLPPAKFQSTHPVWRTTVGIDMGIARGFAFRYTFWESVSANPISRQLVPPGARGLANFQSLFSVVKRF